MERMHRRGRGTRRRGKKQALNKLDASSMETTRIREPQGPLVASSLHSERYSPGPLRLSNARSFLDSTSNLYILELWNEEYRDGIKTRGDKIGMDLCIIKPFNDVRRKFSADHYAYW